ncbi:MAG: hypothetical protein ACFFCW_28055 [Candidatus Hodarchaeota archaeon]
MEIKIVINKQNKREVLSLIDQLVEWEAKGIEKEVTRKFAESHVSELPKVSTFTKADPTKHIPSVETMEFAEPIIKKAEFGAWGMFNSFAPGKVALRILINLIDDQKEGFVKFSHLVDACITEFSRSGLYRYRGFPKKTSESARSRLAMHLIMPYNDMGLIRVYHEEKDPRILITKDGFHFSKLHNPLLNSGDKSKYLSEEESTWLICHLKKIEGQGYKEFSMLRNLAKFLAKSDVNFHDIANWFRNNKDFEEWLKVGSRYRDNPKAFSRQLENVARTFASGKIALLRELGIVTDTRATYRVLRNLEET